MAVRSDRHGTLDVYLHGAQVTSWVPRGHDPVLWLSPRSTFRAGAAIRGGVPLCLPWFGAGPDGDLTPSHGPARLREWRLDGVSESPDGVEVVLGLGRLGSTSTGTASGAGSAAFDGLEATYRIGVGRQLTLGLEVRHSGEGPVTFEEALHTYLAVSDVRTVSLEGLHGATYLDRLGGPDPLRQEDAVLRLTAGTDRIYLATTATVVVDDPGARRRVAVSKTGSASTVVWNPWAATAATMQDLGDGWTSMVCVETANVRHDAVTLAPGGTHTMTATVEVEAHD